MIEVEYVQGQTKASTSSGGKFIAKYGFSSNPSHFWRCSNRERRPLPAYIWYNFKRASVTPAKVSFRPPQNVTHENARLWTPTKWQFVGSSADDCYRLDRTDWTPLCGDLEGTEMKEMTEIRGCRVDEEILQKPYKCLGIKVIDAIGPKYAAIHNLRMWVKKG